MANTRSGTRQDIRQTRSTAAKRQHHELYVPKKKSKLRHVQHSSSLPSSNASTSETDELQKAIEETLREVEAEESAIASTWAPYSSVSTVKAQAKPSLIVKLKVKKLCAPHSPDQALDTSSDQHDLSTTDSNSKASSSAGTSTLVTSSTPERKYTFSTQGLRYDPTLPDGFGPYPWMIIGHFTPQDIADARAMVTPDFLARLEQYDTCDNKSSEPDAQGSGRLH